MKIAVFGGSFNPLHNGHAMLADTVIKDLGSDKVRFVPTCIPPHKRVNADVSPEKRLEMLELFCSTNGYGHFEVEACDNTFDSPTIHQTLLELKGTLPKKDFDICS